MKVKLKKWQIKDLFYLRDLFQKSNRTYLLKQIPNPYTIIDAWNYYFTTRKLMKQNQGLFYAVIVDNQYIGAISLEIKDHGGEIGYFLLDSYHNKGITTKVVDRVCSIAFYKFHIETIDALVLEENIASRKVLEKNNFILLDIYDRVIDHQIVHLCKYRRCKSC